MNPSFKDNRHDQSIQSISRKKLGCVVICGRESKGAQLDKPFHVMRKTDQSTNRDKPYPRLKLKYECFYAQIEML